MKKLHIWFLIGAIALVVICEIVWAFTATVKTVVEVNGVYQEGLVRCYLPIDEAKKIESGMKVLVDDRFTGKVQTVASFPSSRQEVIDGLPESDYTLSMIELNDWNIEIVILLDEVLQEDLLCGVVIAVESGHPIDFIF